MTPLLCRWRAWNVEHETLTGTGGTEAGRTLPAASLPSASPWGGRGGPCSPCSRHLQDQRPLPCRSALSWDVACSPLPSTAPGFSSRDAIWLLPPMGPVAPLASELFPARDCSPVTVG